MHNDLPIRIAGLSVSYDRRRVLTNIYCDIQAGSLVGVIGPNGAGKSTLFKAILGLIPINAGTIQIYGQPPSALLHKMAYVPQKDEVDWQFPATVRDIVLMGRYPHKRWYKKLDGKDLEISSRAMHDLGISDLANRQIGELSGGQQQRVFLARALCQETEIFMLDEPFVGVDKTTEQRILTILKNLASQGKTLLVVHHDLSSVTEYFNQILLLNQRLVAFGETTSTFSQDNIAATYGPQLTILHKAGNL